jgi:hypothetical protein
MQTRTPNEEEGKDWSDVSIVEPRNAWAIVFFLFFFYYSYVHTRLGSFLPPAPTPSLTTHSAPSLTPPNTQQKLFCPYF